MLAIQSAPTIGSDTKFSVNSIDKQNVIIEERIPGKVPGQDKIVRYSKGKFLGKGGFAKCYELKETQTGKIFAGKIVSKSTLTKSRSVLKLKTEIRIHKLMHHSNIVKFERHFEDSQNVYILLEMCNHKSMMELIKKRRRLTEGEVRYYLMQIIDAVKYMHTQKVIHRDLKLGNLFLKDMQVKIGDFGLAAQLDHDGERKTTLCGTPNYIAPEILHGVNGHSYEVDVWSIGVIIYTLLVGVPPFETANVEATYKRIRANIYSFPEDVFISDNAKLLVKQILHPVPECRPSLEEIINHRFFTDSYIPRSLPESALEVAPPLRSPLAEKTNTFSVDKNILKRFTDAKDKELASPSVPTQKTKMMKLTEHNDTVPDLKDLKTKLNRMRIGSENLPDNMMNSAATVTTTSLLPPPKPAVAPAAPVSPPILSRSNGASTDEDPDSVDKEALQTMHRTLDATIMKRAGSVPTNILPSAALTSESGPWVFKWVDYSNKYGLGYELTDGSIGAFFNDNTKMIMTPDTKFFEYAEYTRTPHGKKLEKKMYPANLDKQQYPAPLQKKVTLLYYFKNYMAEHSAAPKNNDVSPPPNINNLIYVQKWLRTRHAIIFRLSNKSVQVNFFDHTKVMLSQEAQVVTYVNKQREKTCQVLSCISEEPNNMELINRLKYTRDILYYMISKPKKDGMDKASP